MNKNEPKYFLVTLIFLISNLIMSCDYFGGIPSDVKKYIFEKSDFAEPITLALPPGNDYNRKDNNNIPKTQGREIDRITKYLLIKNDYAAIDDIVVPAYVVPEKRYIIYYKDKLLKHTAKGSINSGLEVILGKRSLDKIIETNQFTNNMMGFNLKSLVVTFRYTIDNQLPGLPKLTQKYLGKAEAVFNPASDKWEVKNVALQDNRSGEYLNLLKEQANAEEAANFKVFGLTTNPNKPYEFIFGITGGKPPYKYESVLLNNKDIRSIIAPYRLIGRYNRGDLYGINYYIYTETGYFYISTSGRKFGWPPELSFPITIRIVIVDSSSPPKKSTSETVITSGPKLQQLIPEIETGNDAWIEKNGQRLSSEIIEPKKVSENSDNPISSSATSAIAAEQQSKATPAPPIDKSEEKPATRPEEPRWSWTSQRLVTDADVTGLSAKDLELMRNEIYARRGWVFKRQDLKDYFAAKPWYKPKGAPQDSDKVNNSVIAELSSIEGQNAAKILEYQKKSKP